MSSNNIVFFQADFPTSITSVGDWHRSGTDAKAGSAAIAEKLSRAPLLLVMPKALKRIIELGACAPYGISLSVTIQMPSEQPVSLKASALGAQPVGTTPSPTFRHSIA
jgi:hypothetical protein